MTHERLQTANLKAKKRWNVFHGNPQRENEMRQMGVIMLDSQPGVYRKRKGCECRECSFRKQEEKHSLHKKLRREAKQSIA